ncbi:phage tail assembly chaperone family protein, TAC [Acinetobacter sp. B10A]|uniref:phage tail assembly chaperone family protein, TAC n=1 Tax=Acinetobacter baretiae TaxID=2605383 RepID=UPI001B3C57FE|nr:phage tail assembly chaperone family protein, TAC [Acinetobacter baretiae]MBF7685972.1 phage tail assembly chaperone family protein, TAC [Acinetobacter baretiae]
MKKLTLDQIKSGSLISEPTLVTIELQVNGEKVEFDTYMKPFSYATAVARMQAAFQGNVPLAGMIASSLYTKETVKEEGENDRVVFKTTFTADEVSENFTQSMTDAIWDKILEVNGLGKEKSNSNQTQNSSVKSELPQDEALKKSDSSTTQK